MALRLYWRSSRRHVSLLVLCTVLGALLSVAITLGTGLLVGSVPGTVRDGLGSAAGLRLQAALAVTAAAFAARLALAPLQALVVAGLTERVGQAVDRRLIEWCSAPDGIAHLESPATADRILLALGSGSIPAAATVASLVTLVSARLAAVGAALILVTFAWWCPIVIALCSVVQHRWTMRELDLAYRQFYRSMPELRRAGYYRDLAMGPVAAKEVRLLGLADWTVGRFVDLWRGAMQSVWDERRRLRKYALLTLLVAALGYGLVLGAICLAAFRGEISLTALVIYGQAGLGMMGLAVIGDPEMTWRLGGKTLAHAAAFETPDSEPVGPAAHATYRPLTGPITFERVTFSYPGVEDEVLDGLDLTIPEGRTTALVGANGAGKTTLVKLLARLYEPCAGVISVGGTDIGQLPVDHWRAQLAIIFQDFVRYELSCRDNVAFGDLERGGEWTPLDRAAEDAGARDLIERLPGGWGTTLAAAYEGGVDLSGGEWQRVALARALLAAQRPGAIVVLDEPTASLDVRAEAELFDRLIDATRGRTTILISHRFSSVRRADLIVVIDRGRVAEQGTHDELVRGNGLYQQLYSLQVERFEQPRVTT